MGRRTHIVAQAPDCTPRHNALHIPMPYLQQAPPLPPVVPPAEGPVAEAPAPAPLLVSLFGRADAAAHGLGE
ncbi:hypothetical protein FRC12_017599 [Ceratobasidium sp. 428]|nr:hypothetical protein FRC12_017599 [Ceratobasidium sp. 428]